MQVEANRSADEYDPSHQHRARRSLKNAALGKYVYISIHYCGYDCLFATIILSDVWNLLLRHDQNFYITSPFILKIKLRAWTCKDFWEFDTWRW